jgi:hypothetical protein
MFDFQIGYTGEEIFEKFPQALNFFAHPLPPQVHPSISQMDYFW